MVLNFYGDKHWLQKKLQFFDLQKRGALVLTS